MSLRTIKMAIRDSLEDLSKKNFDKFISQLLDRRQEPRVKRSRVEDESVATVADVLVTTFTELKALEVTVEILREIDCCDDAERLVEQTKAFTSKTSSSASASEKYSVVKHRPALIDKVESLESVMKLLLETLKDIRGRGLKNFKRFLWDQIHFNRRFSSIPEILLLATTDMQDIVFLMVWRYSSQAVKKIKKALKRMRRTDLVRKLSDGSTAPKEKHSVDEHPSALIHKVATMAAVKELLLETLNDLSYKERKNFKWFLKHKFFQRSLPDISYWGRLQMEDSAEILVDVMLEKCGQQSVEMFREIFMDMDRTDLVQRLPETSSGAKEQYSVVKHWPALIDEVDSLESVMKLLLETLKHITGRELENFKSVLLRQIHFHRRFSCIPVILLEATDMQDIVFFMVQSYSTQAVEKIKEALKDMKRTDLVQKLSDSSTAPTRITRALMRRRESTSPGKSSDKHQSALIHKVATVAAVQQLLLETLNDLQSWETQKFKEFLQSVVSQKDLPDISSTLSYTADSAEVVDQLVQTYGQQSVELIREVFMNMNKTDLVQKLSKPSSGLKEQHPVDEHQPAPSERAEAKVAVRKILSETLKNLRHVELEKFKRLLQFTYFQRGLPTIPGRQLHRVHRADRLVDLMVETQQCVEVAKEVLTDMNRTDLVRRLSETSSGLKETHSVDKHQSAPFKQGVTVTSPHAKLSTTLKDLSSGEFKQFKHVLQYSKIRGDYPRISRDQMETADRVKTAKLMVKIYGQQAVEVTKDVLNKIHRNDLVQRLSESKEPMRSLELQGCRSIMQEPSDWTKVEPKVNSTDADEPPIYSLQSEAGNFECSVSGLRWICKEEVSLQYQFCSWEEPMERMESIDYMPAGPLMDIEANAGKLDEVYLPHWICIDDNPEILKEFAVLHIDDCGDVVEKVSEVTSSHVKLSETVFSPRAVLMKVGFPVKIICDVLIYYLPNTPFLKLHVYLIPHDPALQQTLDKKKFSKGFELIQKPRPDQYLKMLQGFNLAADIDTAKILPERITLRYDNQDPNFYEVYIEKPDRNFHLTLSHISKGEPRCEPVWTCEIRKDDYQNYSPTEEKNSVDEHLSALMQHGATITTDREKLLSLLEHLKGDEFSKFKWFLQDSDFLAGLPCIPSHKLEGSDMLALVDLLFNTYTQQSVEVTKKVFEKIPRKDLVQML